MVDLVSSNVASMLRGFSGVFVAQGVEKCARPKTLLRLYDFEGCPYCRKVRETLSVLDLDFEVRPCPKQSLKTPGLCGASRFRGEVTKLGGEQKFPFLVDENTGVKMHDSDKINKYLWDTYGQGASAPLSYRLGQKLHVFQMLVLFCRPLLTHGMLRVPSKAPKEPLELWGCEGSPYVRFVREALCVLELPYTLRTVAHGSDAKRREFRQKYGQQLSAIRRGAGSTVVQIPFLRDPNTSTEMLESADIVAYLYKTYRDGTFPEETWLEANLVPAAGGKAASHAKAE